MGTPEPVTITLAYLTGLLWEYSGGETMYLELLGQDKKMSEVEEEGESSYI